MNDKSQPIVLPHIARGLLCVQTILFVLLLSLTLCMIFWYTLTQLSDISLVCLWMVALQALAVGAIWIFYRPATTILVRLLLPLVMLGFHIVYAYSVCGTLSSDAPTIVTTAFQLASGEEVYLFGQEYFARYPNNIPITEILLLLFKLCRPTSLEGCYLPVAILSALLTDLAIFFTYQTVKLCRGRKAAFVTLVFSVALIALAEPATIFYTDSLTLWTLPAAAYIYAKSYAKSLLLCRRIFLYCLLGSILAFGVWCKPQIAVAVIAAVITAILYHVFNREKKILGLQYAGISFICCLLVMTFISKVAFFGILNRDMLRDYEIPATHFIAMGLNENSIGTWDMNDVLETYATHGWTEKQVMLKEKIVARLENFGVIGLLKHLGRKFYTAVGYGIIDSRTMWRGQLVNHDPIAEAVQEYTLLDHDGCMRYYRPVIQGCYILLFLLALCGAVFSCFHKEDLSKPDTYLIRVAQISWIGITLFLLLFETNLRYLYTMRPAMIFLAAIAADDLLLRGYRMLSKTKI